MDRRKLPWLASSFLGLFTPCYLVERVVNYYFLTGNPLFGTWSGPRIDLFIMIIISASMLSGAAHRELVPAAAASIAAIVAFLFMVYVACDPRVCYSAGLDGLEPLRMAFDFSSIAVATSASGVYLRTKRSSWGGEYLAVGFATFVAIAYYPVIFTFVGARILPPLDPWAVGILLFALSQTISITAAERVARRWGVALPLLAGGSLFAISGVMAAAYISTILLPVLVMVGAVVAGTLAGAEAVRRSRSWPRMHFAESSKPLLIMVVAVLVMIVIVIPDASVGLIPPSGAPSYQSYGMGTPVYAGAYMDAGLGATEGVSLTLSFAGTNTSVIQEDNFLAAGIGAHSPGCCVDGIDYGYGFYVYAFHSGSPALVASAWEVCDHNAACGGHSWKVLMFQHISAANASILADPVRMGIEWRGHTAYWWYSVDGGPARNFTSYTPKPAEKAYFNTGYVPAEEGVLGKIQTGAYFFQFGILSDYPIGRGGWSVSFTCPATLQGGRWTCLAHARTLQGGESFWKIIWRWGEDYPNVRAAPSTHGQRDSVTFSYSADQAMKSFVNLW